MNTGMRQVKALLEIQSLFNPSAQAILVGDELIFCHANPAYRGLTPQPEQDPIGRAYAQVWPPAEDFLQVDLIRQAIRENQPVHLRHSPRRLADGQTRYFTIDIHPLRLEDEAGATLVLCDTTDLVEAEAALRRSERALAESNRLLHVVLDSIPDPVFLKDKDSRLILANPATFAVLGKSASEVIGKIDSEFYQDPAVGRAIKENDRKVIESGQTLVIEERVLNPGEPPENERTYLSTKSPYRDAQDQVIGLIGITRNITESKQKERELNKLNQTLRESEERYRNLFERMTEGFALHEIRCDETGTPVDYRFLELNPAFERLTGLQQVDVKGKWISEVEPLREEGSRWVEIYGKVALTGEPVNFERYSPALERHYEVFAYRPAPLQFAVIFLDITARKQTEAALQQAREAAALIRTQIEVQRRLIDQREKERQTIARDLHDGPLQTVTGISFTVHSLARACQDPGMANELDQLRVSLQEVVSELRGYAVELRPPALFQFGLRRAIEAHLELFQEKHPGLHTRLSVDWKGDFLPEMILMALFRVYQESINNILKHARASEIQVCLERNERQFRMTISDNGIGFLPPGDPLLLAREGHLGLVGMRERVEAIEGRLEIRSSPGNGTTILVQVPLG